MSNMYVSDNSVTDELPLVSIILPIYNVEKYLEECVESVLNQTYSNLQIILVDDGSPDNCPEMCDKYAEKYEQIEVVHKKNGGLSDARNAGLKYVRGEYIYFLDSDDYIEPNLVERCISVMKNTHADYVVFDYIREDDMGNFREETNLKDAEYVMNNDNERMEYIYKYGIRFSCVPWNTWNKFFRAEFILKNNLTFPDNRVVFAEDIAFILRCAIYQKKVEVISERLYHYRERNDSIMGKTKNSPINKIVKLCEDFEEFAKQAGFKTTSSIKMENLLVRILMNEMFNYYDIFSKEKYEEMCNGITEDNKAIIVKWIEKTRNDFLLHWRYNERSYHIKLNGTYKILIGKRAYILECYRKTVEWRHR